MRATKRLLRRVDAAAVEQAIAIEAQTFSERLSSAEAKEAFTAFLQKRKPDFSKF